MIYHYYEIGKDGFHHLELNVNIPFSKFKEFDFNEHSLGEDDTIFLLAKTELDVKDVAEEFRMLMWSDRAFGYYHPRLNLTDEEFATMFDELTKIMEGNND